MPYNFKEEGFYMVIKAMNNLGIYPFFNKSSTRFIRGKSGSRSHSNSF